MTAGTIERTLEALRSKIEHADQEQARREGLELINDLLRQLRQDGGEAWIGTTEAKRLLGVASENTVKAWATLGVLQSKQVGTRIKVSLSGVLSEAQRRAHPELGHDLDPMEIAEV
ncbi:MAG TPA: hypothetical protein VG015_05605 [Candidatus Dormibacteraeota bacterium]|jgi:hypothetical protein|nr:hypothetical protein [Candidatus Dormibacteraeota bacterium]